MAIERGLIIRQAGGDSLRVDRDPRGWAQNDGQIFGETMNQMLRKLETMRRSPCSAWGLTPTGQASRNDSVEVNPCFSFQSLDHRRD